MKAVIVRHNVHGNGFYPQDSATFCTRHKFIPYSSSIDDDAPTDVYINRIRMSVPGLCSLGAYSHDGAYDLHVCKAAAYDWSEIEPLVTAILEARHEEFSRPGHDDATKAADADDASNGGLLP